MYMIYIWYTLFDLLNLLTIYRSNQALLGSISSRFIQAALSNNPKGTSVISPNWRVSKCRPRGQEKINRVAPSATTCHISRNEHVRRVLGVLDSPASIFSGCQYSTGTFCQSQRRRRFCRSKKPVMGSDPTRNNKDSWVMETGTPDNVHEEFQDLNKNISSISA